MPKLKLLQNAVQVSVSQLSYLTGKLVALSQVSVSQLSYLTGGRVPGECVPAVLPYR